MGAAHDKPEIEETSNNIAEINQKTADSINIHPVHLDKYNFDGSSQEEIFNSIVSSYALINQKIRNMKRTIRRSKTTKIQAENHLKAWGKI
ncbi:unnamed protein product [Blepharisma stoltei]|uniref:Uncharacterized protein n=1 Tax=Blepharisma stoltei TaxID=1481888 RepID=A0AAU9JRG5_9CILI|nr:unnamed protein product [Blepharisma stoltei]